MLVWDAFPHQVQDKFCRSIELWIKRVTRIYMSAMREIQL